MDWNLVNAGALLLLYILVLGFWKPWAKSYADEKAKTFARKEDLDAIVAEVRAVTAAQKGIENKLSGELWNQQTQWSHRRDAYATLLTTVTKLIRVSSDCATTIEIKNDTPALASKKGIVEQELHTKMMEYRQLHDAFLDALSLVQLLGSKQCNDQLEQALTPNTIEVGHVNWAREEVRIYLAGRNALLRQARSDLGTDGTGAA
jgi:hypothetical protein